MKTPNHDPHSETSPLPVVSEHIKNAVVAEMNEQDDLIMNTYWRMASQQPELTSQMANYIQLAARDNDEQMRMMETLTLTYRMLESQAEADQLEQQLNGLEE